MEIIEIDYGTGNRVGDKIYINKNLKRYPGLYKAVLEHEKKHTGEFKLKDILLDLSNEDLRKVKPQWIKFIFQNPKSWINFFPILKLGNQWTFDISIFFIWILVILMIILGWFLI